MPSKEKGKRKILSFYSEKHYLVDCFCSVAPMGLMAIQNVMTFVAVGAPRTMQDIRFAMMMVLVCLAKVHVLAAKDTQGKIAPRVSED